MKDFLILWAFISVPAIIIGQMYKYFPGELWLAVATPVIILITLVWHGARKYREGYSKGHKEAREIITDEFEQYRNKGTW